MLRRRSLVAFSLLVICFAGLIARLGVLIYGGQYAGVAARQSSYTLFVASSRGTIYDRNLKPLVNRVERELAAVAPSAQSLTVLKDAMPPESFAQAAEILGSGAPAVFELSGVGACDDVIPFSAPVRTDSSQLAAHVVGYCGAQGGVCGIEAGYDALLAEKYGGIAEVTYSVNALGGVVGGRGEVEDSRNVSGGVVLTLDRDIQSIVESSAAEIERGAVVVMRVDTGEISAICSLPDFDVTDVAAYLESADSALFNRAVAAYNVGSIFKICVAAAALEVGIPRSCSYTCEGYYQLGDARFYCHEHSGHGTLDMAGGLRLSCNPYFIFLGRSVGAARLIAMAEAMGFGSAIKLAEGVVASGGSLPALADITLGELANLSFGQGELTASPVQICRMLSIVANGGYCVIPTLVLGETPDGAQIQPMGVMPEPVRVISASTAEALREMLIGAVKSGTGRNADPQYCGAGGKTSSAQTGMYIEGEEVVHAWFAGFFPTERPRYAVAVFSEGGISGGKLPAAVFRDIAERITLLENPRIAADS